jgi:hypothetical protein
MLFEMRISSSAKQGNCTYYVKQSRLLIDIITIAICGVIGGADDWVAIAEFGRAKQAWFKTFLRLPYGIPSHDTFGQIFAQLDPGQFRERFIRWVAAISELTSGEIVRIDNVREVEDWLSK